MPKRSIIAIATILCFLLSSFNLRIAYGYEGSGLTPWGKLLIDAIGAGAIGGGIYELISDYGKLTKTKVPEINTALKRLARSNVGYQDGWKNLIAQLERQRTLGNLTSTGQKALEDFTGIMNAKGNPCKYWYLRDELARVRCAIAEKQVSSILLPILGIILMVLSEADLVNASEMVFIPDSVKLNADYNMFISGASDQCWNRYFKKGYERIYAETTKRGYVELMGIYNSDDLNYDPFKYQVKLGIIDLLTKKWKTYSGYAPDRKEFAMAGIDSLADIEKMNDSLGFDFERSELASEEGISNNDKLRSVAGFTCDYLDSYFQMSDTLIKSKDFTYYPDNYFPADDLSGP